MPRCTFWDIWKIRVVGHKCWQAAKFVNWDGTDGKRQRKQFKLVSQESADVEDAKAEAIAWQIDITIAIADSNDGDMAPLTSGDGAAHFGA